jgi:hypothetical protein
MEGMGAKRNKQNTKLGINKKAQMKIIECSEINLMDSLGFSYGIYD